ncbi:hypothetical protein AXG93_638s1390 [Marchantia polymorpha subsp. ruderalis]|uniref:Kinesin-like protein n=1 Tax=Marchantia polymorpha subsp. ruderalis TaxID=1480154 RepID=A0A176W547_MARPO|nr:hypothetical protein AXG93_638s1390 [Marchantia polymorpha subsp. ruderalis]
MLSPIKGTPGRYTPGRSRLGPPPRANETGNGHRVRVVARVRPFLAEEIQVSGNPGHDCTSISKGTEEDSLTISTETASRCEEYKVDACYGEATDNAEVFANEVQPILQCLFEGRNATVFAYGATGSGKTHTMQGTETDPGLMYRAVKSIFKSATDHGCTVAISYYEVYMDRCYDLLETKNEVPVLEDHSGNIQFRGLAKIEIKSVEEFQALLAEGCARRRMGSTVLNDVSSRSHGVLAVTVTSRDATSHVLREAKLNLIDLAGNEDNRKTGSDGLRLAESSQINQSLFALSNVINALNANDARVPYRDSKLTRILRDSLGGTSRSVMVACLNPGSYSEAAKTLSLAARSRQVVNHTEGVRQGDEFSKEKSDMAAKLMAWKESKTKTPVKPPTVSCSPSPLKPFLMRSPPHVRSPKTPVIKKNPLERVGNKTRVKSSPKVNVTRAVPSKKATIVSPINEQVTIAGAEESNKGECEEINTTSNFSEELYNNCTNPLFQDGDAPSDTYGDEADKENDFLQHIGCPYTPLKRTSQIVEASPPLSVKLKSLARALLPLSPVDTNVPSPSPLVVKTPNDLPRVLDSTFCTPNFVEAETPYERFSKSTAKIRGFGEKRTDAILELRETSPEPMKDITDLERIGVSAKQTLRNLGCTVRTQEELASIVAWSPSKERTPLIYSKDGTKDTLEVMPETNRARKTYVLCLGFLWGYVHTSPEVTEAEELMQVVCNSQSGGPDWEMLRFHVHAEWPKAATSFKGGKLKATRSLSGENFSLRSMRFVLFLHNIVPRTLNCTTASCGVSPLRTTQAEANMLWKQFLKPFYS